MVLLWLGAVALPLSALGAIRPVPEILEAGVPVSWETDVDEAFWRAQVDMRMMLVFFTAPNCPACKLFKGSALENSALQPLLRRFERVEVDVSKRPELVALLQIEKIPALYVIDLDNRVKGRKIGPVSLQPLQHFLEDMLANDWSNPQIDHLITTLASGEASADQWRKGLAAMDNRDIRGGIMELAGRLSPADTKNLVACLLDKQLAVRLGALDLLEEVNDTIIGFDPWIDPDSGELAEILGRWRMWANSGEGGSVAATELTREKFNRYIQDLIGENRLRSRRALQILERGGESGARLIVEYLQTQPPLNATGLRRIKEVQYALVIPSANGLDPQATAHSIVWGNQDVQIRTIRRLADCGIGPAAIVVDLLSHEDPLVRETAVEILFKTAGVLAVAPVKKMLEGEVDPDVSFAVLKHLGDAETRESRMILESYFTHDNEDLVIAAIRGAVKSATGSMGRKLLPLLEDPRWRVRVAAIEGIKEKGGEESGFLGQLFGKRMTVAKRVVEGLFRCLDDPDAFVRHTAAVALGHLKIRSAEEPLKMAYQKHPDMHGIVVSVLIELGISVPSSQIDDLFDSDPEDLLFVLDNIDTVNSDNRKLIQRAAQAENPDVACSALRIIAGSKKRQAYDNSLLVAALESAIPEKQLTVIQELTVDSDSLQEVRAALKSTGSPEEGGRKHSRDTDVDVLLTVADLLAELPDVPVPGGGPDSAVADTPRTDTALAGSPLVRTHAMILLCQFGYPDAFPRAVQAWPELTASMRAAVARSLHLFGKEAVPLFLSALDDNYTDVWEAALRQLSEDKGRKWFIEPFRDYLLDPASRLTPAMMWDEGLQSLCEADPGALSPVARTIISSPDSYTSDQLILALTISALAGVPDGDLTPVLEFTKDTNPFIRRAAWLAVLSRDEDQMERYFDTVLADPSRYVRELIPVVLKNTVYDKTHVALYFSEGQSFTGYRGLAFDLRWVPEQTADTDNTFMAREKTLSHPLAEKLTAMAGNEPDPLIRFRCMLCLLSYKIPLDLGEVYRTARLSGRPEIVADLLENFFLYRSYDLGESFKVLLPLLENSGDNGGYHRYMIEPFLERWGESVQFPSEASLSFTSVDTPAPPKSVMATFTDRYNGYGEREKE